MVIPYHWAGRCLASAGPSSHARAGEGRTRRHRGGARTGPRMRCSPWPPGETVKLTRAQALVQLLHPLVQLAEGIAAEGVDPEHVRPHRATEGGGEGAEAADAGRSRPLPEGQPSQERHIGVTQVLREGLERSPRLAACDRLPRGSIEGLHAPIEVSVREEEPELLRGEVRPARRRTVLEDWRRNSPPGIRREGAQRRAHRGGAATRGALLTEGACGRCEERGEGSRRADREGSFEVVHLRFLRSMVTAVPARRRPSGASTGPCLARWAEGRRIFTGGLPPRSASRRQGCRDARIFRV